MGANELSTVTEPYVLLEKRGGIGFLDVKSAGSI